MLFHPLIREDYDKLGRFTEPITIYYQKEDIKYFLGNVLSLTQKFDCFSIEIEHRKDEPDVTYSMELLTNAQQYVINIVDSNGLAIRTMIDEIESIDAKKKHSILYIECLCKC